MFCPSVTIHPFWITINSQSVHFVKSPVLYNVLKYVLLVTMRCSFLPQPPYSALSAQFTAYRSTPWTIYTVRPACAHAAVRNCVAEGEIKEPSKQGSINILCPVVNGNVISRSLTALLSDEPISLTLSKPLACETAGKLVQ